MELNRGVAKETHEVILELDADVYYNIFLHKSF
jgi:hypothetical protein